MKWLRYILPVMSGAALLAMGFSYQFGANPPIDYPRLLISDTQQFAPDGITPIFIFDDQEIVAATNIQALQFQSSQFYSFQSGRNLPTSPVSYLRIAALLLDAVSANKARLSSIKQMLDIRLDSSDAAIQLRETAKEYREVDDDSGAFVIIEQVNNYWSFSDRFWKQVQRQQGI